uniref:glucuronosyltransferase n=3 Tax=Parascaris univalens TaxID=6257 RepID=A0A915B4P3_PARUN
MALARIIRCEMWTLLDLVLLSNAICVAHAANILVYSPSYSASHLMGNARIADTLAESGHNVVMFIPEYEPIAFNKTNFAKIITMHSISEGYMRLMDEFAKDFLTIHTASVRMRLQWEYISADLCEQILKRKDELNQLRAYKFDIGFSEQLDLCGVGMIRYLGIPHHIWISSTPIMEAVSYNLGVPTPLSYVPVVEESNLSCRMSFMERAYNMYLWLASIYIHRRGTDMITLKFRKYIDANFKNVRELAAESALCFVNSDEFLDVARPILHKTIYIGGLGVSESSKPLQEPFSKMLLKGKKGVVLFSLGTMVPSSMLLDSTKEDLFKVFAYFDDYHFIMKVDENDRKSSQLAENIPNVDLVQWMPQADILGHPRLRLFIMHGGFYGMLEAAIRGVPLLAIPFFGDQFRNARSAEIRGIGLSLQKYEMNYEKLVAAISELLNNDEYRNAAKRLSAIIHNKPNKPHEQLIKWTNFVAKFGSLPELNVEGAQFDTIKYFCIDIIFVFFAILAVIFLLICTCLRVLLTMLRTNRLSMKKNE